MPISRAPPESQFRGGTHCADGRSWLSRKCCIWRRHRWSRSKEEQRAHHSRVLRGEWSWGRPRSTELGSVPVGAPQPWGPRGSRGPAERRARFALPSHCSGADTPLRAPAPAPAASALTWATGPPGSAPPRRGTIPRGIPGDAVQTLADLAKDPPKGPGSRTSFRVPYRVGRSRGSPGASPALTVGLCCINPQSAAADSTMPCTSGPPPRCPGEGAPDAGSGGHGELPVRPRPRRFPFPVASRARCSPAAGPGGGAGRGAGGARQVPRGGPALLGIPGHPGSSGRPGSPETAVGRGAAAGGGAAAGPPRAGRGRGESPDTRVRR